MRLHRFILSVGLSIICFSVRTQADEQISFPTDTEINLLLTQAERAVEQYKPLIDQEEVVLGKEGASGTAKDREVVAALELGVRTFKKEPQGFNGPLGFTFFEWIDDASRNALLCSGHALLQASKYEVAGDTHKAYEMIALSNSCTDASALLYTVSENAGSLYEKYVKADEQMSKQGFDTAQKCTELLRKMKPYKEKNQ